MKVKYFFFLISLLINPNNVEVKGNCDFATSFFDSVLADYTSSSNVILAPFSLLAALAMLYLDATGNTASEILNGMHLKNMPKHELVLLYKTLLDRLAHQGINYKMANRLYFGENITLFPAAVNATRTFFNSDVVNIDLKSGQDAADKMNQWVNEIIGNNISAVITKEMFWRAHGILVTVTYFSANWKKPFPVHSEIEHTFEISNGSLVPVIMSTQNDYFEFTNSQELDAKLVLLPLENSTLSVLLLLPNQRDGLNALESRMQQVNIKELPKNMSQQYIRLTLPHFKVSFNTILRKTLRRLGIGSILSYPHFEALTNATRTGIVGVVHNVVLEIPKDNRNKDISLLSNWDRELGNDFVADHPFLFYIMDDDMIYFVGHFKEV